MTKKTTFFLIFILLFFKTPTFALEIPEQSKFDHRIKFISYNPADVVQIDTVIGIATHLILEKNEQYITHAFGDSEAYAFSIQKNHIFIKPKAEQASTNLIVVTDHRSYNIKLNLKQNRNNATYQVVFRYPECTIQHLLANKNKKAIENSFNTINKGYNLSYTMSGSKEIAPINVWDNGNMTYFKFSSNTEIPAIYLKNMDKSETIVNYTIIGKYKNIVMVHKVNARWTLRLGKQTLEIFNEAYNLNSNIFNNTGTISPAVKRVIRDND